MMMKSNHHPHLFSEQVGLSPLSPTPVSGSAGVLFGHHQTQLPPASSGGAAGYYGQHHHQNAHAGQMRPMSAMSQPVSASNNNGYAGYNYGAVPTPFTQSAMPNGHLPNNNYAPAATVDQTQPYYWGQ